MALELIIISFLAGATLGLRFKVTALVPVVVLAVLLAVIFGAARDDYFSSIIMAMISLGIAVQFGYLGGLVIRGGFASFRARECGEPR